VASFAANRDIKIEASETSSGRYMLRTRGLDAKRRAELEIAGVPEIALNGAGGVINMLADYTVNVGEVLAGQTVGNTLAVGDSGRRLLMVVRAIEVEKPKSGLWSKIAGGGKGILRLVDVESGGESAPLTAIATMLVHRAAVRRAKDDVDGARSELEAAIATFPGAPATGKALDIEGVDGTFNAQNHIAYLELAAIAEDESERTRRFEEALARSQELATLSREGATRDELLATYAAT
jgi:hypothetical protein